MVKQRKNFKKLIIPYYPSDEENKGHYEVNTLEEKIVCKYTGFNFNNLEKLDVFQFWLYLRDAVIYNYMQTKEGIDYLDNCWRINQTEPDREGLRRKSGNN